MSSATFFITHKDSNSRVIVEFVRKGMKVRLQGVSFIRGNVVSLNSIRQCREHAHHVLVDGG